MSTSKVSTKVESDVHADALAYLSFERPRLYKGKSPRCYYCNRSVAARAYVNNDVPEYARSPWDDVFRVCVNCLGKPLMERLRSSGRCTQQICETRKFISLCGRPLPCSEHQETKLDVKTFKGRLRSCSGGRGIQPTTKSESPIETSMLLALSRALPSFALILQQIPLCGGKYRADFVVILPPSGLVVVECDGHDFHEKTKEQAARDKKRDRDIQIDGWRVLRFTGSEIYANADRCAQDVLSLLRLK